MRLTPGKAFTLILFIGLFVLATDTAKDPDFWWHLQTGKYIAENRVIPHADPSFAFTTEQKRWTTHEWLSEVFFWEAYNLGGLATLSLFFGILITSSYALVYIRSPGKPYVAGFATLLGALAALPLWNVRPQMFTLFFLSLMILLLERYVSKPTIGILVALPVIMLLWVNLHAGFLLGLVVLFLFLAGNTAERYLWKGGDDDLSPPMRRPALAKLAASAAVCLVVTGVNPNGYGILAYPFQTLTSPAMQKYIGEWFSPDFHELGSAPLAILLLGILALGLCAQDRHRPTSIALLATAAYAALRSVRNVPLFSVVAAPVMASQLTKIGSYRAASQSPPRIVRAMLGFALVAIVFLAALQIYGRLGNQAKTDREVEPVGAVEWIERNRPPGRLFNTYHWGGYLIWRLYPQYQVFIDGRADLHGDEMIVEYRKIHNASRGWEQALQDYGIQLVLVEPDSPLALQLEASSEWEKVYTDKLSALFAKRQ